MGMMLDNVWILPSNPTYYNVNIDFKVYGKCNWYQTTPMKHMQSGDTVYIYFSKGEMRIGWKCVVGDSNFYLKEDDDTTHSSVKTDEYYDGPFVEIIPEIEFDKSTFLSYKTLKDHGLKSRLMGPQRMDSELFDYLEQFENGMNDDSIIPPSIKNISVESLEKIAISRSKATSKITQHSSKTYKRDPYISEYTKRRANGICQLCGMPAPFVDKDGNPYLESHHIVWLSKGGADSIENTAALCPNCHKKMHVLADPADINILKNSNK